VNDLVEFLRAQFEETDERCCGASEYEDCFDKSALRNRELDAMRLIVDECDVTIKRGDSDDGLASIVLRALAEPYAGRPGYRQEWRL
jgi:hypothetical protein